MQCPKCKHVQRNSVECEGCGLIFSKYKSFQEKKKLEQEQKEAAQSGGSWLKYLGIAFLMVASAGATYYFTAGSEAEKPSAVVPLQISTVPEQPQQNTVSNQQSQPSQVSPPEKAQAVAIPGNPLEHARKATVTIQTPWGTGSGFFVNKYYIVTNRHVVEFDESKLVEFRDKVEKARQLIELEKQKIDEMRDEMRRLPKGPTRSQLAIIIESREEQLAKILPQYEAGQQKLDSLDRKVQPSDIKIIMSDGSEYEANYLLFSDKHDLALMSLFSGDWDYIRRSPENMPLQQGDKVYAIGSPYGLRQTVTAGIISGSHRHRETGERYLQTDAAINPGNSGGPLIDEYGFARGVNTMIYKGTEGIAFAIPIDVVFEEFSSTLF